VALTEMNEVRFENVAERVKEYIDHSFLDKAQVHPITSRFHFDVASAILQSSGVPPTESQRILEALLLLEQGLSIHDDVDGHPDEKRQLHVLAGDYCSSQYYWILARLNDAALLDALCSAVIDINEAKMSWCSLPIHVSSDMYMELQEIIHGQLLFALADHFLPDASAWKVHIQSIVRAFVVKEEVTRRKVPKYFTLRQAYDWLTDAMERVIHAPANVIVQPILLFVMDYLAPIKSMLESQSYAEGNR
jgi:heptaprenyl diphosphate synthase